MSEHILEVRHLSKSFGSHDVLTDIDFTVNAGDVTSIIGASGSGKSTLLRCINLLETPTGGEILYHGRAVTGANVNAAEYRSHVGMVFQSFNLFNNMTVLENCMVGQIKVLHKKKDEARERALYYLEKAELYAGTYLAENLPERQCIRKKQMLQKNGVCSVKLKEDV